MISEDFPNISEKIFDAIIKFPITHRRHVNGNNESIILLSEIERRVGKEHFEFWDPSLGRALKPASALYKNIDLLDPQMAEWLMKTPIPEILYYKW